MNRVEEAREREDEFDKWLADQDDAVQLDYALVHKYGTVRDLLARLDAIKAICETHHHFDIDVNAIEALCSGKEDP